MGLVETCANCGQGIGKLEVAHVWGNHVVCSRCYGKLSASPAAAGVDVEVGVAAEVGASSANTPQRPRVLLPGEVICQNPNCGYVGKPRREATGSAAILIVLLLLWILPGVLYWIFFSGYTNFCPRCGMKLGKAK